MKPFITGLLLGLFVVVMIWAFPSHGATLDTLVEYRYINPAAGEVVKRNKKGDITRSGAVINAAWGVMWCPTLGRFGVKSCPDFELNHIRSLACGGVDAVSNLIPVHVAYKHGYYKPTGDKFSHPIGYIGSDGKFVDLSRFALDRLERKINALTPPIPDTANCVNKIVR